MGTQGLADILDTLVEGGQKFCAMADESKRLKAKLFKSRETTRKIEHLEAEKAKLFNSLLPLLQEYVPEEYWAPSLLSQIRDYIKNGQASTVLDAITLLRMRQQSQHERLFNLTLASEIERRSHRND